ncbi:hypothetical protein E2C01_035187 [Portunus trituberculatus]|uniref:Uncharacterized protein n=1 Tax=Portunus trituberculatus TaxID=210409 RepID=A0A5B7F7T2_PORTR|nr:hypothetical protein [Portunus trituberculatus]
MEPLKDNTEVRAPPATPLPCSLFFPSSFSLPRFLLAPYPLPSLPLSPGPTAAATRKMTTPNNRGFGVFII